MRRSQLHKDLKEGDSRQREQQKKNPRSQNRVGSNSGAGEGDWRTQEGQSLVTRDLVRSLDFTARAMGSHWRVLRRGVT